MTLKYPLTLPIFFLNEQVASMENVGIDCSVRESDIREITFYSINAVSPYMENYEPTEFTSIFSSGEVFICSLPVEEVKKRIFNHR